MKKLIIVLIAVIFLIGCEEKKKELTLEEVISQNNYIVVDVRTKEEYDESHVKGSINIPYDTIDENTDLDKNKTILVYCKSGVRSSKAYDTLNSLGYDVVNIGAFDKITLEKE